MSRGTGHVRYTALCCALTVVFNLFFYVQGARAISIIPGSERTYNGHNYALLESASWISSQMAAVALGGNLVTINDMAENDFVFDTYANFGGGFPLTLWTGLHYVDDGDGIQEPQQGGGGVIGTDDWQWVAGEPASYRNWFFSDPNGFASEPYVAILPPWQSLSKQWFDANDGGGGYNVYGVVETTPEPSSIILVMLGGLAMVFVRRHRTKVVLSM